MSKSKVGWLVSTLAGLALLSANAGVAYAAPVTWKFTGVVTESFDGLSGTSAIGKTVSGFLTMDTDAFQFNEGTWGQFWAPTQCTNCPSQFIQSNPLQVSGQYTGGSRDISVGGGAMLDDGKFLTATQNEYSINGSSVDLDAIPRFISITVYDFLATGSIGTFHAGTDYYDRITLETSFYDSGYLTSLSVCSNFPGGGNTGGCFPGPGPFPASEPASLTLVCAALLGVVAIRRRRFTA
jgi:hypothetical protein